MGDSMRSGASPPAAEAPAGPLRPRRVLAFDWGAPTRNDARLRAQELTDRLQWFVTMRWAAIVLVLAGAWSAYGAWLPATALDHRLMLATATILVVTNVVYVLWTRRAAGASPSIERAQQLVAAQIATDFMALAVLSYAFGTVETPVMLLYLPHVVLGTLLFSRRFSLALAVVGGFLASFPLVLEHFEVLPVISIFESPFKVIAAQDPSITAGYVAATEAACLVCWYLVSEVITSLRRRERHLEVAFDVLQQVDEEKTRATLRATHELKAPFAAIKSYVMTMRDGYCGELPPKALEVVQKIGARCDLLAERISEIIHHANLKTLVPGRLSYATVDLGRLLSEEVEVAGERARLRSVEVRGPAEPPGTVLVRANAEQLRVLLSNLLENAVSYSHENGVVEVQLQAQETGVLLAVIDHGIGIPEQSLGRIFDEYYRASNAVAHSRAGNGLGLAIVKEIARLHDAEVGVESAPNKGSRFTVTFPLPASQDREG